MLPHFHLWSRKILKPGHSQSAFKGTAGSSVAIDEAHEMCINRDMKMATIRETPEYLQKTLKYRITAHNNLMFQLFPDPQPALPPPQSIYDTRAEIRKMDSNIQAMMVEMKANKLI